VSRPSNIHHHPANTAVASTAVAGAAADTVRETVSPSTRPVVAVTLSPETLVVVAAAVVVVAGLVVVAPAVVVVAGLVVVTLSVVVVAGLVVVTLSVVVVAGHVVDDDSWWSPADAPVPPDSSNPAADRATAAPAATAPRFNRPLNVEDVP
jgi:hypothetical protein